MSSFKLLPIPLLMASISMPLYADHVNLPVVSVEGNTSEVQPYALPLTPVTTTDTADIVKQLPGANINRNGAITSVVQYRGLFGNRVNVKLDGMSLSEVGPNSMDAPLTYLPPSRAQSIALYRGIAPVRTGIETIGGSLEAESLHLDFATGDTFEFHGNANAGYASNGHTRQTSLTTAVANQHHRFQIAGTSDRGDDLSFDGGTIRSSEQDRDTASLHYGYQNEGQKLAIDVDHLDSGSNGTPALPMDIEFIRGENYRVMYQDSLANGDTYNLRLRYQDVTHKMDNYSQRTTPSMMQRFVTPEVQAKGINFTYTHQNWTFGFDGDESENDATIFNPNNANFFVESFKGVERNRYSLFTEWQDTIATDWSMEAGVRYSMIKMDADKVDSFAGLPPAVAMLRNRFNNKDRAQDDHLVDLAAVLTHNLSKQLDIEFGLARKSRAPSYQERYLWIPLEITAGLADGNNYIGNLDLDPEEAYQFELGLNWHTTHASIAPRIFYHHINDYIQGVAKPVDMPTTGVSTVNGDATPLTYSNVDAKLYGIDANWFVSVSPQWQLNGTVSYVRGQRRDTGDNLYRITPLTARTMLSFVEPTWRIGLEVETVAAQNRVSKENDEQKTSGYALYNVMANYKATENIAFNLGINNLFDRYYEAHLGGYNRVSNNPDIAQGAHIPGIGRSAYANVTVNW